MMVHNKRWHMVTAFILMAAAVVSPLIWDESVALAVIAAAVSWQFFVLFQSDVRIERKVEGVLERELKRYGPWDNLP
jgi:hypothetical protein